MFHFDCGSQRVTVRTAVISDVDRLADLYRAVQITAKQCHEALNAADGSFQQRGGMFEISSAAAIEQLVRDPAETVLVGESCGSVCGCARSSAGVGGGMQRLAGLDGGWLCRGSGFARCGG